MKKSGIQINVLSGRPGYINTDFVDSVGAPRRVGATDVAIEKL